MPRASERFNTEAGKDLVHPVLLVRLLDIPEVVNPEVKHSLYLTDCDFDPVTGSRTDVGWFDEEGFPQIYTSCGIRFEQCEVDKESTIDTVNVVIDNVSREFSALAQTVRLNGVTVHVWRGFKDLLAYPDGAQLLFIGRIKQALINEYALSLSVWADFSLKKKAPRRMYWVNLFPYLPASKDVRTLHR